jgi:hypothetical protein
VREQKNKVHKLRWPSKRDGLPAPPHEAIVVGGCRPYINFTDPDGCGTVSVNPGELRRILASLRRMGRSQ